MSRYSTFICPVCQKETVGRKTCSDRCRQAYCRQRKGIGNKAYTWEMIRADAPLDSTPSGRRYIARKLKERGKDTSELPDDRPLVEPEEHYRRFRQAFRDYMATHPTNKQPEADCDT